MKTKKPSSYQFTQIKEYTYEKDTDFYSSTNFNSFICQRSNTIA
ncbi:hypothetical protein VCRA2121O391_180053 [Vibrio crassostreae]|nr:hypothetical protein VCHA30O60_10501 [Vibrio chagasii]CAK1880205.1 hypothetical protein VCRA2117O378_200052 [Vibrio crassostreae]CAK1885063.1 hypothetical protein VCRA2113O356_200054 [Vibrio crassostreae]CAK2317979.1 hypothetical protein VCRA2119O386_220050 [Vibrio crassostreae]CAK2602872.1 hypothetical protein VCRA2117O375_180054 [Vibrio crassostreae]